MILMQKEQTLIIFLLFLHLCDTLDVPSVPLYNAAKDGVMMPISGLGTGCYTAQPDTKSKAATLLYLSNGGRRLDCSVDYPGMKGVGEGISASGIDRKEIFITSKVGPSKSMGFQEALDQFDQLTKDLGTDYIDLLLIHWPGVNRKVSYSCYGGYNFTYCRQQMWKALAQLYNQNKVRAIGVSNFETNHLKEILDMGIEVPSVNQCEFNVYWNEPMLMRWGQARNITFNSYSPLGAPDQMKGKWNPLVLDHPTVVEVAKKYEKKSAAQVLLRWAVQQGIVVNPRAASEAFIKENLDIFDFKLDDADMYKLSSIPAPSPPQPAKVCPDPHMIP